VKLLLLLLIASHLTFNRNKEKESKMTENNKKSWLGLENWEIQWDAVFGIFSIFSLWLVIMIGMYVGDFFQELKDARQLERDILIMEKCTIYWKNHPEKPCPLQEVK
jgi:hypothetical protein